MLETQLRVHGRKNLKPPRADHQSSEMRYAFIKTYKPVLDDADYRAFDIQKMKGG